MNESSCKITICGDKPVTFTLSVTPLYGTMGLPCLSGKPGQRLVKEGFELAFSVKEEDEPDVGSRDTRQAD